LAENAGKVVSFGMAAFDIKNASVILVALVAAAQQIGDIKISCNVRTTMYR
jgi:hypothetical protein